MISGNWLFTGSWDASLRLWAILAGGALSPAPILEFFDLENPITAVSICSVPGAGIGSRRLRFLAAGEETGALTLWVTRKEDNVSMSSGRRIDKSDKESLKGILISTIIVSDRSRSVVGICWLQGNDYQKTDKSISERFLLACATADCSVTLLQVEDVDSKRTIFSKLSVTALNSELRSMSRISLDPVIPRALCVGCEDGSIRLLELSRNTNDLREIHSQAGAHSGAVSAVASSLHSEYFISGGVDGCIRVWCLEVANNANSLST